MDGSLHTCSSGCTRLRACVWRQLQYLLSRFHAAAWPLSDLCSVCRTLEVATATRATIETTATGTAIQVDQIMRWRDSGEGRSRGEGEPRTRPRVVQPNQFTDWPGPQAPPWPQPEEYSAA